MGSWAGSARNVQHWLSNGDDLSCQNFSPPVSDGVIVSTADWKSDNFVTYGSDKRVVDVDHEIGCGRVGGAALADVEKGAVHKS